MASSSSFTNDEIKVRIQKVYAQFVTDVDPDRLSDWLVQENVFTVDQWQRIRHDNPPRDRCRALLNHLFSIQHPRAFLVVRQALKKQNHYLLESIDNQEAESGIRLQALLRDEIQLQELMDAYENHKRTWEAEKDRLLKIQKEHEVQKSSWKAEKARLLQIQKEQEYKERAWEAEKDRLLKKQNELETKLYQVMKEDASVGSVLPSLMSKITLAENTSGSSVDRQSPKDTANTQADLETEMNIVFEVGRRMSQLHLCENHSCSCIACLDDFDYIELQIEEYRNSVTSKLLETGFLEIYQQVIRRCFKKAVTEGDDVSENACLSVMIDSSSIVTRMTDNSFEACRKIIQLELDIDIISSLKSGHLDPRQKKQSFSSTRCDLVDALVKVLYNVVQVATEAPGAIPRTRHN